MNDITAKKQQIALLETEIQGKLSLKQTLLKEIEELKKSKRFEPKPKEEFFYLTGSCKVFSNIWEDIAYMHDYYSAYNCFKTKKEAQLEADRILLLRELRQFAKECNGSWVPNWNDGSQTKYGIVFDREFAIPNYNGFNPFIGGIVFKERISAINALEKFKNRLHILINN